MGIPGYSRQEPLRPANIAEKPTMQETEEKAQEAADFIIKRIKAGPAVGVILGSGLGSLARVLNRRRTIPYSDIPHFPIPTVEGHEGTLSVGELGGLHIAAMQGRFHYYEGFRMRELTFPVRVFSAMGVKSLIVTNASGGIGDDMAPGSFMAISDHINLMGVNPLNGIRAGGLGDRDRFVDMTEAYDPGLLEAAMDAAGERGIRLVKGVLAAVSGPSYETPAEVRMLKALGADAVCMSTVPEVIMARYLDMKVLGISLITNRAAGLSATGPVHIEVLEMARRRHDEFTGLLEGIIALAIKRKKL